MFVGTKEIKWKDLFLVLEEDAFLWEDRYMDSHSMTSYVPITIHANMLGYFPGLIHTQKIHRYGDSGSLYSEIKLPTSVGSSKKQESSRKTSISVLLTIPKPLTVCITAKCGKFFEKWEYQTTLLTSCKPYMQVKKQQLEMYMEPLTGSKSGKGYVKAVYYHPAI